MTARSALIIFAMVIATTVPFVGQEKSKQNGSQLNEDPYEKYVQQRGGGSKKRLLNDASDVTLRVVPAKAKHDNHEQEATGYRKEDGISFQIEATNGSPETLIVGHSTNLFDHYLPELTKNGEVVPYRESTAKRLKRKDPGYHSIISMVSAQLDSGETRTIGSINMDDWYPPLEPGVYHLTIKYRPQIGGKWIELPLVTFEVVQ